MPYVIKFANGGYARETLFGPGVASTLIYATKFRTQIAAEHHDFINYKNQKSKIVKVK